MELENLFRDFTDYLISERNSSKLTIEAYKRDFNIFLTFLSINSIEKNIDFINTQIIRRYISYMKDTKSYSSATIRRKINSLRSFFNFLMSQEYITKNPMAPVSAPKKPDIIPIYLPVKDLNRLLSMPEIHSRDNKLRDKLILELFAFTGIRRQELINLNYSNVDFANQTITVRCGKGQKDRIIPITEPLVTDLWDYLQFRLPLINEALIISSNGNRISVTALEQLFRRYVQLAGLSGKGYTIHKLRATYASLLLQNGCDLISIQQLLGHKDLNSTRVYSHTSVEHLKSAVQKHPLARL
jgi:site-specific recombinase XerD